MVIDTSAIVAAIANEPDSAAFRDAIKSTPTRLMSALTLLETKVVLFARHGPEAVATFDELVGDLAIAIVPLDGVLADAAFDAFRRYGKGRGSPAQLNIIDCAAYALARSRGMPLLFKGGDFARTDVAPALA